MPLDPEILAGLRSVAAGSTSWDQTETRDPMTLAELRVFAEGCDVTRGHNLKVRSAALTLLARNAQTDEPSPYEEADLEVEVAIFGLLYCLEYLSAALDIDFENLVATAHACFSIRKDEPKQRIPSDLDGPA